MTEVCADLLSLVGLIASLAGATIAAIGVVVTKEQAIILGSSSWVGSTREERLNSPKVQAYLKGGRRAMWGLIAVAAGTFLQAVPLICRLLT